MGMTGIPLRRSNDRTGYQFEAHFQETRVFSTTFRDNLLTWPPGSGDINT
jgi:hypothetical protein